MERTILLVHGIGSAKHHARANSSHIGNRHVNMVRRKYQHNLSPLHAQLSQSVSEPLHPQLHLRGRQRLRLRIGRIKPDGLIVVDVRADGWFARWRRRRSRRRREQIVEEVAFGEIEARMRGFDDHGGGFCSIRLLLLLVRIW